MYFVEEKYYKGLKRLVHDPVQKKVHGDDVREEPETDQRELLEHAHDRARRKVQSLSSRLQEVSYLLVLRQLVVVHGDDPPVLNVEALPLRLLLLQLEKQE